jgi:tRNA(Ser,Leu) C12 N-acetylase TAN1
MPKEEFEILEQYISESGRYPDPEELAYILSVRTGREYSTLEARKILNEHYWAEKKKLLEDVVESGIKELKETMSKLVPRPERTGPSLKFLKISEHWFRKRPPL